MNTVNSVRLGGDVPLGKKPAADAPDPNHIPMAEVMESLDAAGALPTLPANFGHGLTFPDGDAPGDIGMHANGPAGKYTNIPADYAALMGAGDCVEAMAANSTKQDYKLAGLPVPSFSDMTVLKNYSDYTTWANKGNTAYSYNAQTGANDGGTDMAGFLNWWQQVGYADDAGFRHKIGGVIYLKAGDLEQLYYAAYLGEKVAVGFKFQETNMKQFDKGQPWSFTPGEGFNGGHCVMVESKNGLLTWAARQGYESSWYQNQADEGYTWISKVAFKAVTGLDAENLTVAQVTTYLLAVAKLKAAATS